MNTSLGNGFSNMMITLFLANQQHISNGYSGSIEDWVGNFPQYVQGVFEGDDGLCVFHPQAKPITRDFTDLGLIIKLEDHSEIGTASFCGNLFDPIDKIQVCDPRRVLCTIGWSNRKYVRAKKTTKHAILRCKANSYLNQYPGCPIIQELSSWILRCTSENLEKEMAYIERLGFWKKIKAGQAYQRLGIIQKQATPGRTRLLVERLFDVDVQAQLDMESWFRNQTVLGPIDLTCIMHTIPDVWKQTYEQLVMENYDDHPIITLNEKELALEAISKMERYQPTIACLKDLII